MALILLLFAGIAANELQLHEAEEGSNLTLSWDSPIPMDLSRLHLTCLDKDDPKKMLIYVIGGVQKYQDAQFSGRVQCDKEALRQGRVRLLLALLTPLDSGQYRCEMAANYDPDKGEWGFITTESFTLKVTPKHPVFITNSHGDTENGWSPAALVKKHDMGIAAAVMVGTLLAALFFMVTVMFLMRQIFTADKNQ